MRALPYSGSAKITISGIIIQALKMLIDAGFSVVGQRARLIQRRSGLVPDTAVSEWEKVYHAIQQSGVIITTATGEK
jgi:hypothetical protein